MNNPQANLPTSHIHTHNTNTLAERRKYTQRSHTLATNWNAAVCAPFRRLSKNGSVRGSTRIIASAAAAHTQRSYGVVFIFIRGNILVFCAVWLRCFSCRLLFVIYSIDVLRTCSVVNSLDNSYIFQRFFSIQNSISNLKSIQIECVCNGQLSVLDLSCDCEI